MLLKLKSLAEQSVANSIHIERSASLTDIMDFMASVRPRPIRKPLIRIGAPHDGGYLLPDDLDGITSCISPGVSEQVGFDGAIAARGIDVFMADASVERPPIDHERFHFTRKFLDTFEDDTHTRLETFVDTVSSRMPGDSILQMDIEGAEYRVLLDTNDEVLTRFRIITIEFHYLTHLFGKFSFPLIRAAFHKLLRYHHVVHIHPNNISPSIARGSVTVPDVMEFTFWRKDRADLDADRQLHFPHALDTDNHPECPPLVLPSCWQ